MTRSPNSFRDLDTLLCGSTFRSYHHCGTPIHGKTALGLTIADNSKLPALIFSLEMSKEPIFDRLVAKDSGLNLMRIRTGKLEKEDWSKVNSSASRLHDTPIHIVDKAALHFMDITRLSRWFVKTKEIKLIVVDYLQLVRAIERNGRVEEVSSITRALKMLAKDLSVPVVALSQLNRGVELRDNKRPRLADLRDSGAIEQDADVVALLYRDEVYNPRPDNKGEAELIIAKHRNGPCRTISNSVGNTKTTSFSNWKGY